MKLIGFKLINCCFSHAAWRDFMEKCGQAGALTIKIKSLQSDPK